ncbi:MAG TPA: flagellar protein G [Thermoplasmataceae archaeon]|nr:flagellar protein G [Thermoplasmatales archaeon AK]HLH86726.1 flagellar protein G [Thermoplasmataceae archaeon]
MASMATSEMIFFIATLVLSVTVVGVLGSQTTHLALGIQESGKQNSNELVTSFEIINDPSKIPYQNGYVFYVKNTGSTSFYFTNNTVTVLIDGNMYSGSLIKFTTPSNSGQLNPAQVGQITVNTTLSAGYHDITVTLNNGVSNSLIFQI